MQTGARLPELLALRLYDCTSMHSSQGYANPLRGNRNNGYVTVWRDDCRSRALRPNGLARA